ncbi:hypothetical protein CN984_12035 [Bacillus cereus]|uniref:Uncharacterized protein n=1 Tax=Bacillus cereus TaxID=1396 RepID=A0A2A7FNG7_BACCE|nr:MULTISPECIES: hypothetical protein [Bacillus cereus group]PEA25850.1 hypothetical protein CON44_18060 [Bacillus cereus]PGA05532.1 hypothetical protein COL71_25265 [Bacillus mycoides]PGO29169.1 hypothetical protein CN984_12035 [Bacillus cereus]
MGVDYYNCEVCNEIFSDAGHYGHCGGCEENLCGSCYDEMRKKYGEIGENHEKASFFGEEVPNCCDACNGIDEEKKKIDDIKAFVKWMAEDFRKSNLSVDDIEKMAKDTLAVIDVLKG